ncbi:hypothetical protein [Flavobacterium sp.]|jgi:hypothetical protein|uniref:hypothetical protein n=1 Tax=Flavobacterium sp. TaxID=239 RepID=UPI0037BEA2C0
MKLNYILITILLLVGIGHAKTKLTLTGTITNFNGNLTCIIYNYKDGIESKLTKIENSKGTISYPFDESAEEGIYRLVLVDNKKSANFDFILSSEDKEVKFTYDLSNTENLPVFLKSSCNKDWYSFIKFDIENKKSIRELEDYQKTTFSKNKNISSVDSNKAITNLKNEYLKIKNEFIITNKNKFAVLMLKCKKYNHLNFNVESDSNIDENALISESMNKDNTFLSTPLFKDYVHFYVLKSGLNSTSIEDQKEKIKKAFSGIIDKFSENNLVRKCAIRYAILGFKDMNDEETANYFSEKYNYRM